MTGLDMELRLLWAALIGYVLAGSMAIFALLLKKRPDRSVLALLLAGLALHTLSIVLRWLRLEHGPFITMFEILSSNVWSMTLIFGLAYWKIREIRPTAAIVLPLLFIMMGWVLVSNPGEGFFPPTYDTVWLYIHIFFGKIFFGAVMVALGMALVILLRSTGLGLTRLSVLPPSKSLDELAFRFLAIGLIFDTLMLVAGAIWAQDAWGRYWSWDPLETWAFITWLVLAFAIHLRITLKPPPAVSAGLVCAVFVLGFLTFFGVPFISTSPHKGAV